MPQAREALFEGLLESAPDAIVITDADGRIVLVNSQAEKMFGYARAELLGQAVEILVPDSLRQQHVKHRAAYMANPRTRPMGTGVDLAGRRKDGGEIPVEISLSPLRTAEGLLITSVIRDISERKRHQQELATRARQQAIVAELGRSALSGIDLYMLMDQAAALVADNLGVEFSDVLEYHTEEQGLLLQAGVGWKSGLVGRARVEARATSPAGHAFQTQQPVIVENLQRDARFPRPSLGQDHAVASGVYVIIYGQGRPFGVLGAHTTRSRKFTGDDVHFLQAVANVIATAIERKRNEQQQRERDLLRAEQMVAVGQVAAGVAHELRNPLTSIKGLVQVNRKEAEARGLPVEDLRVIEQEVRRMERTLQTFLDFARPPQPARRLMPLAPLVERVFALIGGRAGKQKVALQFAPPLTPVLLEIDQDQIQQLLLNLGLNALDAMPGGGTLRVELRPPADGCIELRVLDTGPGIAGAMLPRIFDPFVSTKETGLGLGLAVSRRVAEDHGGSLTAGNRPEGGACFVLRLPVGS